MPLVFKNSCLKNFTPYQNIPKGNPGNITLSNLSSNVYRTLVKRIVIKFNGPIDDDVAVKINNSFVFDTRLNVGWYKGSTQTFFPALTSSEGLLRAEFGRVDYDPTNPNYYRVAIIKASNFFRGIKRLPQKGDVVSIFVFDGWEIRYQTNTWKATVERLNGEKLTFTGGSVSTGNSQLSSGLPWWGNNNYYRTGPHIISYIPNGSFVIP